MTRQTGFESECSLEVELRAVHERQPRPLHQYWYTADISMLVYVVCLAHASVATVLAKSSAHIVSMCGHLHLANIQATNFARYSLRLAPG